MRHAILIVIVLMALALFAESRSSINVSGIKGDTIFGEISNNSTNNSSSFIGENKTINLSQEANKTINLSQEAESVEISGSDWIMLLKDIMNSSNTTGKNNSSSNLSAWGSAPKAIPPPPDPASTRTNEIIRQNHLGY